MAGISNSTDRFNGVVASKAIKVRCVGGLTSNVALLNGISNPYDGFFLVANDRVLLTGQTDPIQNGIWCVSDTAWSRAADWDGSRDVELGSTVWAGQLAGFDLLWQLTAPAGVIQPGNTAVTITVLVDPGAGGTDTLQETLDAGNTSTTDITMNGAAINFTDESLAVVEMLVLQNFPAPAVGIGSAVLNFNGVDGDRTYTGDDGRVWAFVGTTGANQIDSSRSKWHSTAYLFGNNGAPDADAMSINVQAENADFHPGTRDWYVRFWINQNDVSFGGANDLCAISSLTGTNRVIRWQIINNGYAIAYSQGGVNENVFPTFGASAFDNQFHEVVFERVGNSIYCYEDGVQSGATFDATGDNIGVLALGGDRLVVLGGSISAGTYDLTPAGGSMDAFEMRIGANIYGGIAPGSPQSEPPIGVSDVYFAGNPDIPTRIHGSYPIIAGNLDVTGNVNVGGDLTGVADELPVLSPAGTGSITLDWRTEFNPRLSFIKGGGAAEIDATGQLHIYNAAICNFYGGGPGGPSISCEHNGVRGNVATSSTGGYLQMSANNGSQDVRFSFGTGIKIQEKAAAHALTAAFGQLWVRNDVPNVLVFTDDAGTDFEIGGTGVSGGSGAVGSIKYIYTGGAGGDPGVDSFRTSTGNLTLVTAFYFSDTDIDSLDVQNILRTIPVGGHFVIRKVDDSSQFRVYAITATTENASWFQFNCDYLFGNGDTTALTANDEVTIEFFTGAYVEPGAEVAGLSDILYWEGAEARWEASGATMRVNPNSPPTGGRLAFLGTAGFSTASPLIMNAIGAVSACLQFTYGTTNTNGFYQRFEPSGLDRINYGVRLASVNTDVLTFNLDHEIRFETGAVVLLGEKAAAGTDVAGYGQLWVRSSAPNRLTFTDDIGTDQLLDPSISEIISVVASRTGILSDKGKTVAFTGATAAQTMTIPANGPVPYPIGTFLGFDNSGSVSHSIAITTDTLIFADDNSTGTRTLAAGGAAVAQKVGATTWKIAGAGLT